MPNENGRMMKKRAGFLMRPSRRRAITRRYSLTQSVLLRPRRLSILRPRSERPGSFWARRSETRYSIFFAATSFAKFQVRFRKKSISSFTLKRSLGSEFPVNGNERIRAVIFAVVIADEAGFGSNLDVAVIFVAVNEHCSNRSGVR